MIIYAVNANGIRLFGLSFSQVRAVGTVADPAKFISNYVEQATVPAYSYPEFEKLQLT